MPAHGSETGSCIVNKRRELYGKGKECWNAVQGQFSMVLLCTLNVICSLPPNMKMKMFLIFGGGGGDILSCLGIDWLLVSNSLCLWPSRCVHQQTRQRLRLTSLTHSPCSPASRHRKASAAAAAPVWRPWPPLPLHPRSAGAWLHPWPASRDYGLRALQAHRPTLPRAGHPLSTSKQPPNRRPVWPWRLRDEEQDCMAPLPLSLGC